MRTRVYIHESSVPKEEKRKIPQNLNAFTICGTKKYFLRTDVPKNRQLCIEKSVCYALYYKLCVAAELPESKGTVSCIQEMYQATRVRIENEMVIV